MRVALYIRVSTQEQAKEGYSIGEQEERLKNYCKAMLWDIYKIYIDPGYSGGDTNRPGLKALVKDVEDGLIDKVVVYKLDRLSRSQLDTLYLIEKVFLANNTDFVSMSENFDTSTPFGRAMIGILAVFAQLEREQIKERMSMGKEARAKEGKWGGGSTEPIGYDYNREKDLLEVNPYEILQVNEMRDLFLAGTPLKTIETNFLEKGYVHKHGTWSPKSMRAVLRSKVYLGYIHYKGEWYKGEHKPTVTPEKYEQGIKLLEARAEAFKNQNIRSGVQTTYLGGLLFCKHCSGKYAKDRQTMRGGKPPKDMYVCYSRSKRVKKMIKDPNCKNKRWDKDALDNIVFEEIKKLVIPERIQDLKHERKKKTQDNPNKIDLIEKEIEKLDEQISRFMDLYGAGTFTVDQVNNKVAPLNEQRSKLQKELDNLNAVSGRLSEEEALEIAETFTDILEYGDFNEIRATIELLISYIEIDNEDIYIHWKFA